MAIIPGTGAGAEQLPEPVAQPSGLRGLGRLGGRRFRGLGTHSHIHTVRGGDTTPAAPSQHPRTAALR